MEKNYVRVIGIDPGLEKTGVGVIDFKGSSYKAIYCGCVITKRDLPVHDRLKEIYDCINNIILKYCPDCFAIEDIFFSANVKTALTVGAARGVLMLAGSNNNLDIYQYTPLQVKQSISGYGRATKKQIKYMLKIILNIKDDFLPVNDDAWDALGVALCHASMSAYNKRIKITQKNPL